MRLGKAVHYDQQNPPRFVLILGTKLEDEFWTKTDKGMLMTATLFPEEFYPDFIIHHAVLTNLRTVVKQKEAEIYKFLNASSAWRRE